MNKFCLTVIVIRFIVLISVIVDGVCFAFGIFYLEFLDYFQENKGKTAWIGSVLNGTYMIMGETSNTEQYSCFFDFKFGSS